MSGSESCLMCSDKTCVRAGPVLCAKTAHICKQALGLGVCGEPLTLVKTNPCRACVARRTPPIENSEMQRMCVTITRPTGKCCVLQGTCRAPDTTCTQTTSLICAFSDGSCINLAPGSPSAGLFCVDPVGGSCSVSNKQARPCPSGNAFCNICPIVCTVCSPGRQLKQAGAPLYFH